MKETTNADADARDCARGAHPPLTKQEEDAVIARAAAGETAAQEEMYGRYRGLILRASRASYLRSETLASEAESIASLAFFEALHDYDPARGVYFAGFAACRVHTALYTAFRRARRLWGREAHPARDAAGGDAWERIGGTVHPTAAADRRLLVHAILARTMHRLTDREKAILSLHYFRDLTLRRFAALLGTSANAVSKSKANLLRKLRMDIVLPLAPA